MGVAPALLTILVAVKQAVASKSLWTETRVGPGIPEITPFMILLSIDTFRSTTFQNCEYGVLLETAHSLSSFC